MKLFGYLATICLCAGLASCENSETFYSASYPVVRVEASSGTSADPTENPPTTGTVVEIVNADILANAPIKAGGGYSLDFTRHNGGLLTVATASGAEPVAGTFNKEPGKNALQFIFGTNDYTCAVSGYTDGSVRKVLLTIDLTNYYKKLYPTWNITSAVRKEYTSTPYK